jgi:pyruvate-ferredoxin/flavodoxin oxidoreductase
VQSGYWPLFRYNPDLVALGKNPLQLDSKAPAIPLEKYIYNETRYTMLTHSAPEAAAQLLREAQEDVYKRWKLYEHWAAMPVNGVKAPPPPDPSAVLSEAATSAKGAGK